MSDTDYSDTGFPPLGPDTPRTSAIARAYWMDDKTTYGYLDPEEIIKFAGVLERELAHAKATSVSMENEFPRHARFYPGLDIP